MDTHTHKHAHTFYGPLDFVWDYPSEPLPEPVWILLMQETVSGNGISWAICKSALQPDRQSCQHPIMQFLTGWIPFLPANQQHQSTEGMFSLNYKNVSEKKKVPHNQ